MPFRPKPKQPQFADLKGVLSQSKQTDNALYQTVQILIERLTQFQGNINDDIQKQDPSNPLADVATRHATYLTRLSETGALPQSSQLIAGLGITLDDTVVGKLKISTGLGTHYDCPLSDGDLVEANIIYAAGECVIVQVPIL